MASMASSAPPIPSLELSWRIHRLQTAPRVRKLAPQGREGKLHSLVIKEINVDAPRSATRSRRV